MLTSFFGKSKPIHFILLLVLLVLGSFFWHAYLFHFEFNLNSFKQVGISIGVLVFSFLVLNFFIVKNKLTQKNSYSIFLWVCFLFMFPAIFMAKNIGISNLFLFLALRRILSLSSEKNTQKKILDASIFICLASVFYFWSFLFFIVLFFGILQKPTKTYKLFLIPLVGFFSISTLFTTYGLLIYDSFTWLLTIPRHVSFAFFKYNNLSLLLPIAFLSALIIWVFFHFKSLFIKIKSNQKPTQRIILLSLLILIILVLLFPKKTGAEFLFLLAPLSILTTNYIETIQETWFIEILLWVILILPFAILFV